MGKALMVQGTGSSVGKSLLVTALCRYFANQGLKVAPFKAQNMSNNARIGQGGEMATAQYLQALAARVPPEVRMNPVLVKPEGERRSQVVVWGKPDPFLSRLPWQERKRYLWPWVERALLELLEAYDLVLIEGAGSPAELNLKEGDIANMRVAERAQAPVLLVADMDRGGALAALYGTWALLEERHRIRGFILNKFRGDPGLLQPIPRILRDLTGVPLVGVVPYLDHALPEEDAASLGSRPRENPRPTLRVAVVRYPYLANFDEFKPLEGLKGVGLVWATRPEDLEGADLVILPGSKHVAQDLAWLRAQGLEGPLKGHVAAGKPLLGICGGLQMLGESLKDPLGVEGEGQGLGLLPLETVYLSEKVQRVVEVQFGPTEGFWAPLRGLKVKGYEIHHGQSRPSGPLRAVLPDGLGFQRGPILGLYLHGLFENPQALRALFGEEAQDLETALEALANRVGESLDLPYLESLLGKRPSPEEGVSRLILVTGGARSGKSRFAEGLAARLGGDRVTFVATALPLDPEMERRIARHREGRNPRWETLEAPYEVPEALRRAQNPVVLLDCLSLYVSNLLLQGGEEAVEKGVEALLQAFYAAKKTLIVVTNEVGSGVVPENPLARLYRDLLGWANQRLMAVATQAYLLVAGQPLRLKGEGYGTG